MNDTISTKFPEWRYCHWQYTWRMLGSDNGDTTVEIEGENLVIETSENHGPYNGGTCRHRIYLPLVLLDELRSLRGQGEDSR